MNAKRIHLRSADCWQVKDVSVARTGSVVKVKAIHAGPDGIVAPQLKRKNWKIGPLERERDLQT